MCENSWDGGNTRLEKQVCLKWNEGTFLLLIRLISNRSGTWSRIRWAGALQAAQNCNQKLWNRFRIMSLISHHLQYVISLKDSQNLEEFVGATDKAENMGCFRPSSSNALKHSNICIPSRLCHFQGRPCICEQDDGNCTGLCWICIMSKRRETAS